MCEGDDWFYFEFVGDLVIVCIGVFVFEVVVLVFEV